MTPTTTTVTTIVCFSREQMQEMFMMIGKRERNSSYTNLRKIKTTYLWRLLGRIWSFHLFWVHWDNLSLLRKAALPLTSLKTVQERLKQLLSIESFNDRYQVANKKYVLFIVTFIIISYHTIPSKHLSLKIKWQSIYNVLSAVVSIAVLYFSFHSLFAHF